MKTFIIAEAGVNHNGNLDIARQLIAAAAAAKADCVKFQTFQAEDLATPEAPKAAYQLENGGDRTSQYQMLKSLELSPDDHHQLLTCCREHGIEFLSSPFSVKALEMLIRLGVDKIKLPSGEVTNYPLLLKAAGANLPVILSTGMATLGEVEEAVDLLLANGLSRDKLILLLCTTEYPTPLSEVNLLSMQTLSKAFGVKVGLSDHTQGLTASIAGVALGATVIEKHFTLDKEMVGPDHKASLDPQELTNLVRAVREVEECLGSPFKTVSDGERKNREVARKSLHLTQDLPAGTTLTDSHLKALRPGDGVSPMHWPQVVGRTLKEARPAGHKLVLSELE